MKVYPFGIMNPIWKLTLVSFLLFGCSSAPHPVACEFPSILKIDLPERGISAHRGGRLGCPDNTIGAFQRAICQGVHQIELDVRSTGDAELVIVHDNHVTDAHGKSLTISDSTLDDIKKLRFRSCTGRKEEAESIPTLEETLAIMPQNIWINLDIKENNPVVARLVAETVKKTHRLHQVIFAARNNAAVEIRRIEEKEGLKSWIGNMSRQIFRSHYIDTTIASCDEFIQLSFLRGKPSIQSIDRLKQAGIRINYSWLREGNESELREEMKDLFDRGVNFTLVDHPKPAIQAACVLGIQPVMPQLNGALPSFCTNPPSCKLSP